MLTLSFTAHKKFKDEQSRFQLKDSMLLEWVPNKTTKTSYTAFS